MLKSIDYNYHDSWSGSKEIVHFYNTRDTLPRCQAGAAGEKVSCWPAPENAENINTNCCDLGLSDAQRTTLLRFSRPSQTKHSSRDQASLSGVSCTCIRTNQPTTRGEVALLGDFPQTRRGRRWSWLSSARLEGPPLRSPCHDRKRRHPG